MKPVGFHNEFNVDQESITISKNGKYSYIHYFDEHTPFFASSECMYVTEIHKEFEVKYIYYYFKYFLKEQIENLLNKNNQ